MNNWLPKRRSLKGCVLLPNLEEHDRLHPHDAAMIADRGERDDDGANNNHENAMDGDDTPENISVICVVSMILYGIFLWIDRWEYRRRTE